MPDAVPGALLSAVLRRALGRPLNALLGRLLTDLLNVRLSRESKHRHTVAPDRVRTLRLGFRHAKIERFSNFGDRIAPGIGRARRHQPRSDCQGTVPASNLEQPFHGIVHRPRHRDAAGRGQRLERIRLADRNARLHPDCPLPDDHRYLHAASVRNASRSR